MQRALDPVGDPDLGAGARFVERSTPRGFGAIVASMAAFHRSVFVMLVVGLAACRGHEVEVRVLARGEPPAAGWSEVPFAELYPDGTCERAAGEVAFRRPEHTTNPAKLTCYRDHDGRVIAVSLRLPDEAWARAGWTRCSAAREQAFAERLTAGDHACR